VANLLLEFNNLHKQEKYIDERECEKQLLSSWMRVTELQDPSSSSFTIYQPATHSAYNFERQIPSEQTPVT